MTTIFDLEATSTNDLPAALVDAHKAAKLARLAVEGLLMKAEHSAIDEDDVNLIQECAYTAQAHAWNAQKLYEAAAVAPLAVVPPLNEPVTYGERVADCPVCGAAILKGGDDFTCNRCKVRMHPECFWGRVATLVEFQEYLRQVHAGPEQP